MEDVHNAVTRSLYPNGAEAQRLRLKLLPVWHERASLTQRDARSNASVHHLCTHLTPC